MSTLFQDLSQTKRTKIIATLGPASSDEATLTALIQAGVNVIRLNMSHGNQDGHRNNVLLARRVAEGLQAPLAILADLQGPKIRTGPLKDQQPITLQPQDVVRFTTAQRESEPGIIATNYRELTASLTPDTLILINDGKIELRVESRVDAETLLCRVVTGGLLEAHKGINVPNAPLDICALTEKDRQDALFCTEMQVDYLALSFVRRASDITELRDFLTAHGHTPPPIIAKIEKPEVLPELSAVLANADGLMVARGDLGVEMPAEQVPIIQKLLVDQANRSEKPVIIATQMLESMIVGLHPNRAEVSDVANAVFDGADALMLSGETATGAHPVETVAMMSKIIREAEKIDHQALRRPHETSNILSPNFYHAIAHSASYAATKADVQAIVVLSSSGTMARRISKLKPQRPIIALTPDPKVYNRLSLLWGVTPVMIPFGPNTDVTLSRGEAAILQRGLLHPGDSVVFCAGNTPLLGASNMLKIYRIGAGEPQ